jgi:DNA-binding transcriptional MocR family regulator
VGAPRAYGSGAVRICYVTVMLSATEQYLIGGRSAATIVRSIERGVTSGALAPGAAMPSVRALARDLAVSPTTVAAAYRDLRQRGVLVTHDRSRTVVGHRPPLSGRLAPEVPPGSVDLASGNPDPRLLPRLGPALAALDPTPRLYGAGPAVPALLERARTVLTRDGVPTDHLAVLGGGLDGIERVLEVHLRVGDRIAVEDPGYVGSLDLTRAMGLSPVPVPVDDEGPTLDGLAAALDRGVQGLLVVPRAQNPTGAATSAERARDLRDLLGAHPEVLVVEDDHAAAVSGPPLHPLVDPDRERWAVVRSVAKGLGPDLRVAVLAGDEDTVARVLGRQRLGTGWVSHLLQHLTVGVWATAVEDGTLERAAATYAARRAALRDALADHDLGSHGASGLNVWVPVPEEVPVVQGLLARGWAVQAGEPFRIDAPPGIRITVAALPVDRAPVLAADLAQVLDHRLGTRRG